MIVCKFGGSSVGSPETVGNIKKIIASDNQRRIIVVSALGNFNGQKKVTDMLIDYCNFSEKNDNCYYQYLDKNVTQKTILNAIFNRYKNYIKKLKIKINLTKYAKKLENYMQKRDFSSVIGFGECLSAVILSKYLDIKFIDARQLIYYKNNNFNYEKISNKLKLLLSKYDKIIVPGFYGIDENKNTVLMSRGGSDLTGAVLARATDNCRLYENWTDVNCFYEDYISLKNPYVILGFNKAKYLCENGAKILHKDVFKVLENTNVNIQLKNTFNPLAFGTFIKN